MAANEGHLGGDSIEGLGHHDAGATQLDEFAEAEQFDDLLAGAGPAATVKRRRSRLGWLLWLLSLVPVTALGLLLSMAVRVRLEDGVWPVRNQPDPKDLGLHNTVTVAAILLSFVVVLLIPLIALAGHFFGRRPVPIIPPLLAVASLAVLFVILAADIGGLGDWIGD